MALFVLGLDDAVKSQKRLAWASSGLVTSQSDGGSVDYGTSDEVARKDHRHVVQTATAVGVGTSNAQGSSAFVSRADHVHAKYYTLTGLGGTGLALTGTTSPVLAIDSGASGDPVTFATGTAIWTFPVDQLQVTGTPDSANDAVNKTYVDNAVSGLSWKDPVLVKEYVGNLAALAIEGLTPTAGDAYVVTTANGAGALTSATVGDIWEYSGSAWTLIIAGSGGFVPAGARALASTQTTLVSPLTDATDDGKIIEWDGTSLTGAEITTLGGWAVLVSDQDADGDSIYANIGYVFEGTVPTGSWIQFTGAGQINAGAGLTKSGNTINVGAGTGIAVGADSVAIDLTANLAILGDWDFSGTGGKLGLPQDASTAEGDIWYDTSTDTVKFYDASGARNLWDDSELAVSTTQYATLVGDAAGGWVEDTGFQVTSGAVTTGSWSATAIPNTKGGTGQDSSGWTGVPAINSGTWSVSAQVPVSLGGTGLATLTTPGGVLYASTASAVGVTAAGTSGQLLQSNGASAPSWVSTAITPASSAQYSVLVANGSQGWTEDTGFKINTGAVTTGSWTATAIGVAYGGTGLTSYTAGDILYATGATTLAKLAKGAAGEILTMGASVPEWSDASSETTASNADTTGTVSGVTAGRLVYMHTTQGGYVMADGTTAASSVVAGVSNTTASTLAPIDVAYNGRVTLAMNTGHADIAKGDILYLAQEAGGFVVAAADIAYTTGYVQLPVAVALENKTGGTAGAILAVLNPVGIQAITL